ncbi:phage-related baseplate assembly protein [Fusobacterium naviforme]|nr:phage-related baseplate assembly protein [Fusobacterium naviforme]STO27679.1 Uncharacterized homolog of phage Mu protein gp47 [Fusobacterium naviforme]
MARNTEYQFLSTDAQSILQGMISDYEQTFNASVTPASAEMLFIRWMANLFVQERAQINHAGNQNLPSRAEGENLDELGSVIYNLPRPEAKHATSTERFTITEELSSSLLIPAGTRVTDKSSTVFWATTEDAYIAIGDTYADVPISCLTSGSAGNGYVAGQIDTIVDRFSEYLESVTNLTETEGGTEVADDDEYYDLMVASLDSHSTAGAENSYIYWAKQVSTDIADVVANTPEDGVVEIYALMNDGSLAGEEMKAAILEACSAAFQRPLTDHVFVDDAQQVTFNINFTYYIPSDETASAADIAASVQEAVDSYVSWQCGKFGRDISPDRLRYFLYETGIKRLELTAPAFTVLGDGSDNTAPQVGKIGTITIVNGGYEDE